MDLERYEPETGKPRANDASTIAASIRIFPFFRLLLARVGRDEPKCGHFWRSLTERRGRIEIGLLHF